MTKKLTSILLFILIAFFLILAQLAIINFLIYPLNTVNLLLLSTIWLCLVGFGRPAVWLALLLGLMSESFSVQPYGILLLAIVSSVILVNWLLLNLFTNRTFYIVILAGLISVFAHNLSVYILIFVLPFFRIRTESLGGTYFKDSMWSALLTTVMLLVAYTLSRFFMRWLKSNYLRPRRTSI